jgi:serine/threonine protein kinase/Tfp pilus assembly protein PilF
MTKPRASRVGPYEILALIGVGGMGEVYRAHDSRLNREVAIKFLPDDVTADAERRARFEREARTLASLNHPNIATIYGLEELPDGARGLVLELVEGPTLAEFVARGPVPTPEALSIAKQIADALAAAHDVGVVHRDLKPHNIKVRPDGSVKVLDFGLAKTLAPNSQPGIELTSIPTATSGGVTRAGSVLGTPAYMSPEQTRGREVDQRSDVWAFGCVVYETLTGSRAFEGDDVPDIIANVLRGEPDWARLPADLPQAVEMLLRRCLEKDPARRLRSIGDVQLLIEDSAARSIPPAARALSQPPSVPPNSPPSAQRRMPSNGVIMAVAGSLVAITAIIFRPDGSVPTPTWPAGVPPGAPPTAAAPASSAARSDRLQNSIAVLPFDTLSAGPEDATFVAGLHMEVLNQIGKLRNVAVISRSSVMRYADIANRPPIAEIAADLGVASVMETTVVYSGDQLRVNAELIEASTSRSLWRDAFRAERGNLDDVFAIQADIASAIAEALGAEITSEDQRRVDRVPTESIAAYQSYLTALDHSSNGRFVDAMREIDSALVEDPRFAEALAHRAYMYAYAQITSAARSQFMNDARLRGADFQSLALEDANRALDIYDGAGVAWLARALTHMFHLRYRDADAAFERALDVAPNDPSVLQEYAMYRLYRGDTPRAIASVERATQFDPNGALTLAAAASVFSGVGRTDDARRAVETALLVAPENITANVFGARLADDAASAERFARNVERLAPDQGAWGLMAVAATYRQLGKDREADAAVERYVGLANVQGVGDADWAQYHLGRNEMDATYERLQKVVAKYESGEADAGYITLVVNFLNPASRGRPPDPRLDELRFQTLLNRLRELSQQ